MNKQKFMEKIKEIFSMGLSDYCCNWKDDDISRRLGSVGGWKVEYHKGGTLQWIERDYQAVEEVPTAWLIEAILRYDNVSRILISDHAEEIGYWENMGFVKSAQYETTGTMTITLDQIK